MLCVFIHTVGGTTDFYGSLYNTNATTLHTHTHTPARTRTCKLVYII